MTQSYNLSQLANNLNTAGQLDATDGLVGAVPVANGGTGLASYTTGDLIYANGTTSFAKLADVASGNALISGGVGAVPVYGKIGLTTHISGTLSVANGGTGNSFGTATNVSGTVAVANGGTGATTVNNAAVNLGIVGVNQTWQSVTRTAGTTYVSPARPIMVSAYAYGSTSGVNLSITVQGVIVCKADSTTSGQNVNVQAIVPANSNYTINLSGGGSPVLSVAELT